MGQNNQVIVYNNKPLEKIAASEILLSSDQPLMEQQRLYLASDIVVGQYGVAGFVIVDNKPEDRWISYTDNEKTGVHCRVTDNPFLGHLQEKNSNRLSHYINTSKGFKMIRYFILPSNVQDFFQTDKFLGDPMIDKCCREETLPEEFDEEEVNVVYAFHGEERELIDKIINHVNPTFEQIGESRFGWKDFGHRAYFSFHPWQFNKPVTEAGEESVVRAIRNFDEVLSRSDKNKKLQVLELKVEGAQPYKGILPPIEQTE